MSENTEPPAGAEPPRDPWAAPDGRVEWGKQGGDVRPPAVHDQPTVIAGPGSESPQQGAWTAPATGGFGPPPAQGGYGPGPSTMPPPPVSPNGPGQQPVGQYGYPAPPQPYPAYTGYDAYGGQGVWAPVPSNGMGVTAMVLGIVSICLFFLWGVVSIVLGVLALVFGILGRKRARRGEANNGGQALAGIITGSVGIFIGAVVIGLIVWSIAVFEGEIEDGGDSYDDPYASSLVIDQD
ncbi:DUF4190 domain-containing protein [Streptomyces sp. NBC_00247]|uniref:DUF4190 domain-containing protein n=1 Tax=Streptomyces sp. NBC_00247 TaxID=2975689 RepID=UPI002E299D50|nr:DUF4190 domain-containing protein [Streptomyces sp. NBC_00247]